MHFVEKTFVDGPMLELPLAMWSHVETMLGSCWANIFVLGTTKQCALSGVYHLAMLEIYRAMLEAELLLLGQRQK